MKTVLVTGGAGFIGSHTVDLLLEKGYRVVVFDNFSTGKLANLPWSHSELRIVQADIMDYAALLKEIKYTDSILHLAALPSVPKSIEDPIASFKTNLQGLLHVLQAVRESEKKSRVVYASSAAVYGNTINLPCRDDQIISEAALSPYALEKANGERYANLFHHLFEINSLGLRYFNVYGARQDPHSIYSGVISKFITQYKNEDTITVFGDGLQSRDFIHVKDIARANCLALESSYQGVLNIATGEPKTLLDLIGCLEQAGQYAAKIEFATSRTGDIKESYASTEKAKQHLSFCSAISLMEGIKELVVA